MAEGLGLGLWAPLLLLPLCLPSFPAALSLALMAVCLAVLLLCLYLAAVIL